MFRPTHAPRIHMQEQEPLKATHEAAGSVKPVRRNLAGGWASGPTIVQCKTVGYPAQSETTVYGKQQTINSPKTTRIQMQQQEPLKATFSLLCSLNTAGRSWKGLENERQMKQTTEINTRTRRQDLQQTCFKTQST